MNMPMVLTLIRKDWYFNRWPILVYGALGVLAAVALGIPSEAAFSASSIVLITVLIAIGIHLAMITVVHERTEHTLAFVMSLPVSPREYTLAKLVANLTIFGAAWGAITAAIVTMIATRPTLPDGLIPYALTILLQIFVSYCLTLAVAIISESQAWTIGAIVAGNLLIQAAMYGVSKAPAVAATLKTETIYWGAPIPAILGVELVAIVGMMVLTFYLQARKTDFL